MKRLSVLILLSACGTTSNGTSCKTIADACSVYSVESDTEGHKCFELTEKNVDADCRKQVDTCKQFCTLDDGAAVVSNYGALVLATYDDAVSKATALKTAVTSFNAAPSATLLTAAQAAWVASRTPYTNSEAFRFYGGPIDDAKTGPEGELNSWPVDESYIDYVAGPSGVPMEGGMINGTDDITPSGIAAVNTKDAEEEVTTGYHAIEFLLWGQDFSTTGPGARPFTDYVDGGTAHHQARRRTYLQSATDLLVDDLTTVRDAWTKGGSNYRASFEKEEVRAALSKIVGGMSSLARGELFGERMRAAYDQKLQEQEHSCFSDTTIDDLVGNATSIQNVYLGKYGSVNGAGVSVLVAARDEALDSKTKGHLSAAIAAIAAVPAPFDQAILGDDSQPGRVALKKAMDAVIDVARDLDQVIELLGLAKVEK